MFSFLRSLVSIRGAPRSGKWPALRAKWLKDHAACCGCGRTDELEVHHKVPVHVAPTRELDETNLMTLCQHPTWNCHLILGHEGNWQNYRHQPEIAAAQARAALKTT